MINVFHFYGTFIQIALQFTSTFKTDGRNYGVDWG